MWFLGVKKWWNQTETCLKPNRKMFSGKFVKSERVLDALREHIVRELRFVKRVRFFERDCIIKWVTFFASFCWLWDFLLEDLTKKKNVDWNVWTDTKNLYARSNIFKKRIPNVRFWITYIFVQILFFGGIAMRRFLASVFFLFFLVGQPWWLAFVLSPPP